MAEPVRNPELWRDPIVEEVRAVREALFAEAGYDIHEFCRRLQEAQENSDHPIVRQAPKGATTP